MTEETKTLAVLMYLETNPKRTWEELQQVYKEKWYTRASSAINCLSKMNKVLVNPSQLKKSDEERFIFNKLVNTINTFNLKLKTTKPALYPTEELAYRIMGE